MAAAFGQAQQIQNLLDFCGVRLSIIQEQREHNILLYVQFRNKLKRLEDKTDVASPENRALFLFHGEQILPIHENTPGSWCVQSPDAVQQGALAGAGLSDHSGKLPLVQ